MNDPATFPPNLALVPEGERILQAFGWAPTGWGLVLLTLAVLTAFQPAKLGTGEYVGLGFALSGWLALECFEVWRRRQPLVIVRRGPQVALYARALLARDSEVSACGIFPRHPTRTWGPILMAALGAIAAGAFLMPTRWNLAATDRLTAALAALAFATLCTSIIRTRLFCEEVLLPRAEGRGFQHLLVLKRDLPRIFRPTS